MRRLVATPSRVTALICVLLGLLGALPLVILTPPLQVADEAQHFARAYQLSELRIWSRAEDGKIGDDLPTSLSDFTRHFLGSTREHADHPVLPRPFSGTLAEWSRPLSPETRSFTGFVGSAFYSPLAYIPQALAIRFGRMLDASPLMLLYAGRLANVLAALSLLAAAVLITPVGAEMLVIVGLLPMTLYEDASLSPDATMIGGAFLFTALALRGQRRGRWRPGEIVAAIVAGTILCSLKPVYVPLLLIGLVPDILQKEIAARTLGVHLLIVACVMTATWLWMRSTASVFSLPIPGTSLRGQTIFVLTHPITYAGTLGSTLVDRAYFYYASMIGMFGWLRILPPRVLFILPVVAAMIALARNADDIARVPRSTALWQLALVVACIALVMTSLYLIWTPVGAEAIEGVQGRYFLPVLGVAAIACGSLFPAVPIFRAVAPARLMAMLVCIGLTQFAVSDLTIVSAYSVF